MHMQQIMKCLVTLFLCFMFLSACSTDKAIDVSGYQNTGVVSAALDAPDKSLQNKRIKIPQAMSVNYWPSSGGVVPGLAGHVRVSSGGALSKQNTYKVHSSFDRDYYFIENTPVILNGTLFVLGQARVYAYNINQLGTPKWEVDFSNRSKGDVLRGGGLYVTNGYVAATYGSDQVSLLNATNGNELWHYDLTSIVRTTPLIHQGKVFVVTIDNKLYCLDLKTGFLKWTYEGVSEQLSVMRTQALTAHGDVIIVPCSTGQLLGINANSGELVWNLSLDDKVSLVNYINTPVINNDIAYVSSQRGSIYALDLRDGKVEWENPSVGGNSFWLSGDYIYTINEYSQLSAVNKFSGKVKWIQDLPSKPTFSSPILVNNKLYVSSSKGNLLVFSPIDGSKLSEQDIPRGKYARPIATQSGLFLLSDAGKLTVLK